MTHRTPAKLAICACAWNTFFLILVVGSGRNSLPMLVIFASGLALFFLARQNMKRDRS